MESSFYQWAVRELCHMIDENAVKEKLQTIYDPEIPVNIYDLGLIYNIKAENDTAYITMTLTTATCPAAAFMPEEVKAALLEIKGMKAAIVDVVYEPRWTRDKMTTAGKKALGIS